MLDLNHILFFIAIASPLVLLARILRVKNRRNRGWWTAALIVLLGSGASWFAVPPFAGYIGGTLWLLLLLVPSLAERKVEELLLATRYSEARRFAVVRQTLHPWPDFACRPSLLRLLERAQNGALDPVLDDLAAQRAGSTPAAKFAQALTFALTENWQGLVEWCLRDFSVTTDPTILTLYLRALGETGGRDRLLLQLGGWLAPTEAAEPRSSQQSYRLLLALAFCGLPDELAALFQEELAAIPDDQRQFWLATGELAAGATERGLRRLEKLLASTRDAILRRAINRRFEETGRLAAAPLSLSSRNLLRRLLPPHRTGEARQGAPAVWAMIWINIAVFGLEMLLGGSTNTATLERLGALEPQLVVARHEYWRLITALFLHYGTLHIAFNLYALYILGPALEEIIGSFRFTLGYLLSGLGSSAGVVVLSMLGLTSADLLVGASGCVMGVIGISAGLLLRHRQTPLAGRRLRNILVIVAFQTAFDLSTPQVSLAAHLSGFVTGVCIGFVFSLTTAREETMRHALS